MEPKPSVGRIVHYRSFGTPSGEYQPECRAAVIAGVPSSDDLNVLQLCVLNPTGLLFCEATCDESDSRSGGTWHWPERV